MLKVSAITHKGFEKVCSEEIRELLKKDCVIDGRFVEFEIGDIKELLKLYYLSQSIEFAFLKISEGKTVDDAKNNIDGSVREWIGDDSRFLVKCEREVEIKNPVEIEKSVADKIIKITDAKINFKLPELRVIVYVTEDKVVIGIDFAIVDLSKRQHKIYKSNNCLKGTLAYCLYRLADNPKAVLDPFCGSGEIVIEAALFETKKSVNFFQKDKLAFTSNPGFGDFDLDKFFSELDKVEKKSEVKLVASESQLRFLKSVKSNAKIAGVDKAIDVMRMDIEWLDSKFDEKSFDYIITQPPGPSKNKDDKSVRKLLSEFFYQSEFILKDDGRIICINRNPIILKEEAVKEKFKVVEELEVWSGLQNYFVVIFSKVAKK